MSATGRPEGEQLPAGGTDRSAKGAPARAAPHPVERRIRQLWLAVGLLCLVVVGLNALYLDAAHDALEREALQRASSHARVLEGQTTRAINGAARALRTIADAVERSGVTVDQAFAGRLLADQLAGQPLLRSLSVVDASGMVVASSTPTNVGIKVPLRPLGCAGGAGPDERIGPLLAGRDLADLANIADLGAGKDGIGAVVALPMRRLVRARDGSLHCVVALLNPERIATENEVLLGDAAVRSAVLGFDGQVIAASSSSRTAPGAHVRRLAPLVDFLPRREQGSYAGEGIDGEPVLAAFRASPSWPLLTVVEQSPAAVTRQWQSGAVWPASAGLGVVLFIIAAGWLEQATLRREAAAQTRADLLGRAVAQSEARFRSIFEQAGVGMVQQGLDGRLLRVNSALCGLLGYTSDEMLALRPDDVVHPDDAGTLRRKLAGGAAGEFAPAVGEVRLRRKDGAWLWVRATYTLAPDAGGQPLAIGVIEDISARRQAQLELLEARVHELDIGARIQRSLLVPPPDQQLPGVWLSAFSLASQGVDGDFIEVMPIGDHCVDVIAGDVMGKGLGAALLGAAVKMLLSRCLAELLTDPARNGALPAPADIVGAVHAAATPNLLALESFVTLCYLRIDTRANTITWVGCGHEEPLLLHRGGDVVSLGNQHPPIGVQDRVDYVQQTASFATGDGLFMFSDGIVDAVRPDGERVGRERTAEAVAARLRSHATPAAVVHALRGDLLGEGVRFTDDVTMLLAVRADDAEPAVRHEVPTALASVGIVREMIDRESRQAGLDETAASLFSVACVEAFTNIVRHARGGIAGAPTEVVARRADDALHVDFIHQGDAFAPPAEIVPPSLDGFPEGGFGLTIMREASDRVDYLHDAGVNVIRLTRHRRRA